MVGPQTSWDREKHFPFTRLSGVCVPSQYNKPTGENTIVCTMWLQD